MSEEDLRCLEQQIEQWEMAQEGRLDIEEDRQAKEEWA